MKILSVSDFPEPLSSGLNGAAALDRVDLILSCGDLPPEYLDELVRAFQAPLYYVRGNHDLRLLSVSPVGCTDLHGRTTRINGLTLAGLEGSAWYNGRPLQYTEAQMRRQVRSLRRQIRRLGGIDIVITHAPPRHVNDAEDPCHRGFECFHRLIDRHAPRYFLHGHVHRGFADPSERVTVVGRTRVINCAGHLILDTDHEQPFR